MRAARCLGLALALLCLCRPAAPWYRQAAGPRHYSVGRASGLLSGLRRSPYIRRSDAAERRPGALPPGSARPPAPLRPAVSTGAAGGRRARGAPVPLPAGHWARAVPGLPSCRHQGPVLQRAAGAGSHVPAGLRDAGAARLPRQRHVLGPPVLLMVSPAGTLRDGCGPRAAELPGAAGSPWHSPVQSRRDLVPGPHGVRRCLSQHRWLRSDNKCTWTGTISSVFAGTGGAAESPCRGGGTHRGLGHAGAAPPGVDPGKQC